MKIESFNPTFAINGKAHRKEKGYAGTYLIIDANLDVKLDLRIYWTESRCYACVWFAGASGSGYAGDYGYEKTSAAAEAAFRCAGLKISGLSASGMITEALELIATEILGLDTFKVIHTHPQTAYCRRKVCALPEEAKAETEIKTNNMDILSIIQEHSLCVRCIPKTVVSVWRTLPKDLERAMKIDQSGSVTKSATFDEKSNMWLVREEKTPTNGGMWYVQRERHNGATVIFGKKSFIAPTIEEAIQLYLNSL